MCRQQAQERLEGQALIPDAYHVQLDALNAYPHETLGAVLDWLGLPQEGYPWGKVGAYFEPGHRIN